MWLFALHSSLARVLLRSWEAVSFSFSGMTSRDEPCCPLRSHSWISRYSELHRTRVIGRTACGGSGPAEVRRLVAGPRILANRLPQIGSSNFPGLFLREQRLVRSQDFSELKEGGKLPKGLPEVRGALFWHCDTESIPSQGWALRDLLARMLATDPAKRPTMVPFARMDDLAWISTEQS